MAFAVLGGFGHVSCECGVFCLGLVDGVVWVGGFGVEIGRFGLWLCRLRD